MARFVDTFARVLGDPALPHLFFVEGGALAVENALKVAFDWKSRWNAAHGLDPALGTVLRLRQGRVDLPMDGGPDVLRAAALWDEARDGRLEPVHRVSAETSPIAWLRRVVSTMPTPPVLVEARDASTIRATPKC